MKHFKSARSLAQLSPQEQAYPIIADLVLRLISNFPPGRAYNPDDDA